MQLFARIPIQTFEAYEKFTPLQTAVGRGCRRSGESRRDAGSGRLATLKATRSRKRIACNTLGYSIGDFDEKVWESPPPPMTVGN